MSQAANNLNFLKWTPQVLTKHLESSGVAVGNKFIEHDINGEMLSLLSDKDIDKMNFNRVGDMLRLKRAVGGMQRMQRSIQREMILYEADEYHLGDCCEMLCYPCTRCCCQKGDHYALTSDSLQLSRKSPISCFSIPCRGCCATTCRCLYGYDMAIDHVYLSNIDDVDVATHTGNCCQRCLGFKGQDIVIVRAKGEKEAYNLFLQHGEAPKLQKLLRDQKAGESSLEITTRDSIV